MSMQSRGITAYIIQSSLDTKCDRQSVLRFIVIGFLYKSKYQMPAKFGTYDHYDRTFYNGIN